MSREQGAGRGERGEIIDLWWFGTTGNPQLITPQYQIIRQGFQPTGISADL